MYCRNCGKEIDDKAVVCVGCGVPPLKGVKYCQACGKDVPEQAEVCASCGAKLAQASVDGGDDKTWVIVTHIAMALTWFVGPLIIWLVKGKESTVVEDQAKEALNFGITMTIAGIVGGIITFGVITGLAQLVLVVFGIIAAVQASNGNLNYRYPFALRLIK